MRGIVKNIIIAVLVVSSVMQTGRLWLGVPPGLGFVPAFVSVITNKDTRTDDYSSEMARFAQPYRMILRTEDEQYAVIYADSDINEIRAAGDNIISALLTNGEYITQYEIDFDYGAGFVVYDYALSLTASGFTECFSAAMGRHFEPDVLTRTLRVFNRIAINLTPDNTGRISVYITDDNTRGLTYLYKADAPYNIINQISGKSKDISGRDGEAVIITAVNPFISPDGVITLRSAERALAPIFGERPINQSIPDIESYRFANDANVVCRYNLSGDVLEYSDYSLINTALSNELLPNYAAALRFIARDTNVKNDIYLTYYGAAQDGYVFRFECKEGGRPVIFAEEYKEAASLASYIEITLSYQKITRYRRFAHYFEQTPDTDIVYITEEPPFDTVFGYIFTGG